MRNHGVFYFIIISEIVEFVFIIRVIIFSYNACGKFTEAHGDVNNLSNHEVFYFIIISTYLVEENRGYLYRSETDRISGQF